jgi:cytochrome b561
MLAPHPHTVVESYNFTAQCLHWVTVLFVIIAYIVSVGGPETRVYSAANDFRRELHELLGLGVFVLTLVRVMWRAIFPPPKGPEMPIWMKFGARLSHWTIYLLLVVVPVTAILGACRGKHSAVASGVAAARSCVGQNPRLARRRTDLARGLPRRCRTLSSFLEARHGFTFHVAVNENRQYVGPLWALRRSLR